MKVSKEDLAWAAGIIEGEAYVTFRRIWNKYRGKRYPRHEIGVGNTDIKILERLMKLFGGSIHRNRKAGTDTNCGKSTRDLHIWMVSDRKALNVAKNVLPYIVGKKKEKLEFIVHYYAAKEEFWDELKA